MNTRITLALFVFGSMVAAGCNNGSRDPFSRIQVAWSTAVNQVCSACPEASGTLTEAECRARADENNPFMGTTYDCERDAYQMYPDELGPTFDCQADAISRFGTCMHNAVATCPPTSAATTACNDALDADVRACPQTDSIAAGTALSACFNP